METLPVIQVLPLDIQIDILRKLSLEDIENVLKANNIFYDDPRYEKLWKRKIKDEFDIVYKKDRAYQEYIYLSRIFSVNTEIYGVFDEADENSPVLFADYDEAMNYAAFRAEKAGMPEGLAFTYFERQGSEIPININYSIYLCKYGINRRPHSPYEDRLKKFLISLGLADSELNMHYVNRATAAHLMDMNWITDHDLNSVADRLCVAFNFSIGSDEWHKIKDFTIKNLVEHPDY